MLFKCLARHDLGEQDHPLKGLLKKSERENTFEFQHLDFYRRDLEMSVDLPLGSQSWFLGYGKWN